MRDSEDALLIVDVQNDFCPGGALAVADGHLIIPKINAISPSFRTAIVTKDWHPAGHISFASSHPTNHVYDRIVVGGKTQVLWPEHCIQGSSGSELRTDLNIEPIHLILHKGYRLGLDSYSAFFENDGFTQTGLVHFLRGLGVTTVFLAGLATDYCVYYTAMDALRTGFKVVLVTDAMEGVDQPEGSINHSLKTMEEQGAKLIESTEII